MPRIARIVIPGVPHHITQRGNNRQPIFLEEADYRQYLALLKCQAARNGLEVFGYCLMTNHVHLIATPEGEASLAKAIGRVHFLYTQYFNRKYKRVGHLWQNRFFSCALDERHQYTALQYIECNPVRAHISREAWEYGWSSAAAHTGEDDKTGLLDIRRWGELWDRAEWRKMLAEGEDEEQRESVRRATRVGRPFAGEEFLLEQEERCGCSLRALPVGRPRRCKE